MAVGDGRKASYRHGAYTPLVPGRRGETLLSMMLFIERFTLNRAWSDLSEEEFFWEPAPNCWSVRRRDECCTPNAFGTGDWVADFNGSVIRAAMEGKGAEPLTTIAWLFWHVGSMAGRAAELDFLGGTKSAESGWTAPYMSEHPVFFAPAEAVDVMRAGWRALDQAIRASTDAGLDLATRFWSYSDDPGPSVLGYQILVSILNEVSHHGTQVCTLRDVYRAVDGRSFQ
jgi:hypothetical protein